jgi:hypothetical protein
MSAAAGAQVLLLTFAVGALFRRRAVDEILRLAAGFVSTVSLLVAIALTVASA